MTRPDAVVCSACSILDNDAVFQGLDSHNRFLRVVDLRLMRDSGAVARPMAVSSAISTLVSPVLSVKKKSPSAGVFHRKANAEQNWADRALTLKTSTP